MTAPLELALKWYVPFAHDGCILSWTM